MCFFTLLFCYTALSYNIDGELMYHIREKTSSYLEVKKSKFIGILIPIDDEKRLKEHLNQLKKEYPAATHYCYGAIIGQANRSNDDGAMTSMEALPGSLDPPSMFRMALAVASRMSRMLTLRRLLRRAYWLANSMKREKRMAL